METVRKSHCAACKVCKGLSRDLDSFGKLKKTVTITQQNIVNGKTFEAGNIELQCGSLRLRLYLLLKDWILQTTYISYNLIFMDTIQERFIVFPPK